MLVILNIILFIKKYCNHLNGPFYQLSSLVQIWAPLWCILANVTASYSRFTGFPAKISRFSNYISVNKALQ